MSRAHRSLATRRLMVAAGAVAALAIAAVGGVALSGTLQDDPISPADPRPSTSSPAPKESPTNPGPEATPTPVRNQTSVVQGWYVWDETLTQEPLTVTHSGGIAAAAIEYFLFGPPGPAVEDGVETNVPRGTELLGLTIDDGVATVDLSDRFDDPGGSLAERMRLAQVVFTLTQFPTIEGVRFEIEGEPVETYGSHGLVLGNKPQTREDYEDLAPAIIVDTPYAGEEVTSPIRISGTANVFEATVSYRILGGLDLDKVIADGFTTATCGTGCRGRFSVDVPIELSKGETLLIEVFESSAEDGAPRNVVRIPVTFEP